MMVNHSGAMAWPEPFSFWGPIVNGDQATPQYGPLAGTKPMDGFFVTVAPTVPVILVDQNGVSTTILHTAFVLGYIYELSPSRFASVSGGSFLPLYR